MQTLDYDYSIHQRADAGDESLFVMFYNGTFKNDAKTQAEGRLIVDDVVCVRIIIPGDKNNVIDRPADERDFKRFHRQYRAFQDGLKGDEQLSGTRLSDWPHVSRGQCEEFAYLGIKTVEQLAAVRDDVVARVPGMSRLKATAGIWLERAKGAAEAAAIEKRQTDQDAEIKLLKDVVRKQGEELDRLKASEAA